MTVQINEQVIENFLSENNMTKKEFCAMCGIGATTLSKILLGGSIRLDTLYRIAKAMNIKAKMLLK